jgi:hypothetical protein
MCPFSVSVQPDTIGSMIRHERRKVNNLACDGYARHFSEPVGARGPVVRALDQSARGLGCDSPTVKTLSKLLILQCGKVIVRRLAPRL